MPSVIAATVMYLLGEGLTAEKAMLSGLGILFVLEMDDFIVNMLVCFPYRQEDLASMTRRTSETPGGRTRLHGHGGDDDYESTASLISDSEPLDGARHLGATSNEFRSFQKAVVFVRFVTTFLSLKYLLYKSLDRTRGQVALEDSVVYSALLMGMVVPFWLEWLVELWILLRTSAARLRTSAVTWHCCSSCVYLYASIVCYHLTYWLGTRCSLVFGHGFRDRSTDKWILDGLPTTLGCDITCSCDTHVWSQLVAVAPGPREIRDFCSFLWKE